MTLIDKKQLVITKDMVGLKIHKVSGSYTDEYDEYDVTITLGEISEDGLELFGLFTEDLNEGDKIDS